MSTPRPLGNCLLPIVAAVIVSGCNRGPSVAPGPAPVGDAGKPVKRLVASRGGWKTRHDVAYWDEGDGPVEAAVRIKDLKDAIPHDLLQHLETTELVDHHKGRPPSEELVYYAEATVVSLSPDVMLLSYRKWPQGAMQPFEDFRNGRPLSLRPSEHAELIAADRVGLVYYAGTLHPYSEQLDELHVISTDPGVETGPLELAGTQTVIPLPSGRLVLTRGDIALQVERE
jgi:hypothetical protein